MSSPGRGAFVSSLFVMVLAGLLFSSSAVLAQEFIYTANFGDSTISGFSVDVNTGAVTDVPGSPFDSGVGPIPVTTSPDGQFLYVVALNWYQGGPCGTNFSQLLAYRIGNSGELDPWQAVPLRGYCASYATVDPSGQYLYIALINYGANKYGEIAAYQINSGTLTEVQGSPFPSPVSLPSGQGAAIGALAIANNGKVMYGANPWSTAGILVFDRNPGTGAVLYRDSFNSGTPFTTLATTPNGKFLLALRSSGTGLYEYAISADGGLTEVPGSPFALPVTNYANAIALSPNGDFVAIVEQGGIAIEKEDPTSGHLTSVAGSPFGGGFPPAITFDASGKFVYVPGAGYRINPETGVLTEVTTFATGNSPEGIAAVKR
jgi:6-phosphogluconolactonase